jgi:CheY-like chemotaxis protein
MELAPVPCDLGREIAEAARVLQHQAHAKGLYLDVDLTGIQGIWSPADPVRLRQIVVNLVGNGIKFTATGGITLRARVSRPLPGLTEMILEVIDTGDGMSPELLQRLFRPFTQADQTVTRRFGGTGLGLTISRQIAALMGGRIDVASKVGRGSTFTVTVPIQPTAAPTASATQPATATEHATPSYDTLALHSAIGGGMPQPAAASADLTGKPDRLLPRVLLAEDGLDNQRLLRAFLKGHVASFELVENGRAAVDRLTAGGGMPGFDLVLMDMHMPEMDGLTATRRIRAAGLTLPILALTASATTDDRYKCIEAGCDDFLTKPITRAHLLDAVARWGTAAQRATA